MLKSLSNLVLSGKATVNSCGILHQISNKFSTSSSLLLADRKKTNKKEEEDEDDVLGFNKSTASQSRLLERFGVVKPYAKWPQYNRVIYPPSSDGKPTKNPVIISNILKINVKLRVYDVLKVRSSYEKYDKISS